MKWQSRFLVHNTLLGLAYSWREKIALKSLNSILCVCLVYEYLHVGCAMHNKECHMDFSLFYPNTKLASPRNCRPSWGGHYQSIFVGDGIGCMLGVWCRVGNAMPKLRYHAAFLAFFFLSLVHMENNQLICFGANWSHGTRKTTYARTHITEECYELYRLHKLEWNYIGVIFQPTWVANHPLMDLPLRYEIESQDWSFNEHDQVTLDFVWSCIQM